MELISSTKLIIRMFLLFLFLVTLVWHLHLHQVSAYFNLFCGFHNRQDQDVIKTGKSLYKTCLQKQNIKMMGAPLNFSDKPHKEL